MRDLRKVRESCRKLDKLENVQKFLDGVDL